MDIKKEQELKKEYQLRDRVVRVLSKDGFFRVVAIKNTNTAQTAQNNHKLDRLTSFLLARALSGATMMSSFLKGEERIILEFDGAGPVKKVYAESMKIGETRGFVELSKNADSTPINDIGEAIGAGMLKVSKVLFNKSEPITGIVPLQKGDISTDIAYYFAQSEQIPTAVILDVDFDDNGLITQSGGMMVQAMPGHSNEKLQKLYNELLKLTKLVDYFDDEMNPKDMLKDIIPFEFDVISSTQVDFFCRCSKESFMEKLITLGAEELESMLQEGNNEMVCRYCNSRYILEDDDFNKIITEAKAQKN
jgi:molecular chaperone Hsp33